MAVTIPFVTVTKRTYTPLTKAYADFVAAASLETREDRQEVAAQAVVTASESLKAVAWYADKMKDSELETLRTACEGGRDYCTALASSEDCPDDMRDGTLENAAAAFRRMRELTRFGEDDNRTHWLDPMVNVDRIPPAVRGFLWPSHFTVADEEVTAKALHRVGRLMLMAVRDYRKTKNAAALHGFTVQALRQVGFYTCALSLAFPKPSDIQRYENRINVMREPF